MFTLGAEPYAAIPIKQLKSFLNSGQRLDKPTYADINMYAAFFLIYVIIICNSIINRNCKILALFLFVNEFDIIFSYELMLQCWKQKPEERPPFEDIQELILQMIE
jgi:hypothetical protein